VIEVAGYGAYAGLEQRLSELGFNHSPEDTITCRYRFHGVVVDIMPTDVPAMGPTNRWYVPGMAFATQHALPDASSIKVLTTPYFLGTKFEAHRSRGGDMRTSKDFEDIVYVLDSPRVPAHEGFGTDHRAARTGGDRRAPSTRNCKRTRRGSDRKAAAHR
jgi:hypothetical protein